MGFIQVAKTEIGAGTRVIVVLEMAETTVGASYRVRVYVNGSDVASAGETVRSAEQALEFYSQKVGERIRDQLFSLFCSRWRARRDRRG